MDRTMSEPRDYLADIEQIEREHRERRAAAELAQQASIIKAVQAGEALTICGVRYVPA